MESGSAGSGARTPIPGPEALGMRLVIVCGRTASRAGEACYPNASLNQHPWVSPAARVLP